MHPLPDARRFLNCIFMLARISKLRKKDERRRGGKWNGEKREQFIIPASGEEKLPPSPINVRVSIERGPGLVMLRFFPLSLKKPSAPSSIIIRIGIRTNLHVDNEIKKRTPSFRNSFLSFLFFFFSICREWNRSGI